MNTDPWEKTNLGKVVCILCFPARVGAVGVAVAVLVQRSSVCAEEAWGLYKKQLKVQQVKAQPVGLMVPSFKYRTVVGAANTVQKPTVATFFSTLFAGHPMYVICHA